MKSAAVNTMKTGKCVRAFAPASVSNLACGFDILGFAVEGLGDEIAARCLDPGEGGDRGRVVIEQIVGDDGRLPLDAARNTAGVAAAALLSAAGARTNVGLGITKKMPLSSGLGSSAASAVAAVVAVNELLGLGAGQDELLRAAMEGERAACGSAHADNAAPSLMGGLVLVRQPSPPDVIPLPIPSGLHCALVRPHVAVNTGQARTLLGDSLPLGTAIRQWGNVGGLVAGFYREDMALISRSLVDGVAEPVRASLVPGFRAMQNAAVQAGALGCSLSGSGPTVFALCGSAESAQKVAQSMAETLRREEDVDYDQKESPVGAEGARLLDS